MPDVNENRHEAKTFLQKMTSYAKGLFSRLQTGVSELIQEEAARETDPAAPLIAPKAKPMLAFCIGSALGAVSVLTLFLSLKEEPHREAQTVQVSQEQPLEQEEQTVVSAVSDSTESEIAYVEPRADETKVFEVKPKETLAAVLKRAGLSKQDIYRVTTALADIMNLKQIQIQDKVEVGLVNTENGGQALLLVAVEDRRGFRYSAVRNDEDFFESILKEPEVDVKLEYAQTAIDGPFLTVAKNSGVPTNVALQIIWAFDGPIDFTRDLRKGDAFTAVFQKEYNKEGNPTGNGQLLYASFRLRKNVHERFLYKDSKGAEDFYDGTGRIARKLFTHHPLKNFKITSHYGMRKHPILGYVTMHWGTDYAAPVGTPIHAPGEGVVTSAGRKGAYGKYIQIRHNTEYSTAYAHLDQIGSKIYTGKRVKAGEVIGSVGNSGRSTGSHLHWELIKSSKKINPVTQKITNERRLSANELKLFYAARDEIKTALEETTALARAEPLPEDRKPAYQEPAPKSKKAVRKKNPSKHASRKTADQPPPA